MKNSIVTTKTTTGKGKPMPVVAAAITGRDIRTKWGLM
jgi:hypothetical protein